MFLRFLMFFNGFQWFFYVYVFGHRQTLGHPDFPKKTSKIPFWIIFKWRQKTIKKPSAAPRKFEKPSKNPPAAP